MIEFGTDGIRGIANRELTAEVAMLAGKCIAYQMSVVPGGAALRILVAKDTRVSGDMIEGALVAGICSMGVDVWKIGVTPTPCLAFLTRSAGCDAGIMISASHNPIEDNGIKVFSPEAYKLEEETERAIEKLLNAPKAAKFPRPTGAEVGQVIDRKRATGRYVAAVRGVLNGAFLPGRVVADCANGATSRFARRVFRDRVEELIVMNGEADGRRINVDCGSTMPEKLARRVVRSGARLGFAFDGDGDRVIFADERGDVVDGDQVMLLCARFLKKHRRLKRNTVVSTVMSNMGLEDALSRGGMKMLRTPVGDKYVLQEMLRGGYSIGGEQSGHIIFLDHSTTGDGLLTAAFVLKVLSESKSAFSKLTRMRRSGQMLKNVRVPDKKAFEDSKKINAEIRKVEKKLEGKGRLVVRPSGTEPKIRVMAEAWDAELAAWAVDHLIGVVKKELGEAK